MKSFLYLKTHNKTGLKYLGKTTRDPFVYKGSGKRWQNHIKKHGYDVTTEILFETDDKKLLREKGLYYSELWNVVRNPEFANLVNESGDGGDTSSSIEYQIAIKNRNLSTFPKFIEAIKNRDNSKLSALRKGKSPSIEHNLKWYNNGKINIYVTEGTQPIEFERGRIMPKGITTSNDTKQKLAKKNGKKCMSPTGELFDSTKQAGKAYGVTDVAIRGLIKRGVSGWKYI